MSEIRVNNITNRDGSAGPSVAGIPVVDSNSHFVVPTGRTGQRYADGGENIVRDGLVLYLDAKYSYPSKTGITSTTDSLDTDVYTWYDMSGNENHGELVKSPSYNSADGGYFSFNENGVQQDAIVVPSNNIFSTGASAHNLSISSWVQNNYAGNSILLGQQYTDNERLYLARRDGTWDFGWGNFGWGGGFSDGTSSSDRASVSINTWTHLCLTVEFGVATLYVNGSKTIMKRDNSVELIGKFAIGSFYYLGVHSDTYSYASKVSQVSIYNRALTAAEVLQNFNATRSRFSI